MIDPCQSCNSADTERSIEPEDFLYGSGRDAVRLIALVSVLTCRSCGCQMTGAEAESARQAAVRRFLIAERDRPWPRMRSSWRRRHLRRKWRLVTVYIRSGRPASSKAPSFRKASGRG